MRTAGRGTPDLLFHRVVLWIDVCSAGWSVACNLDSRFLVFRLPKVLYTGRFGIKTSRRHFFQRSFIKLAPVAEIPVT